MLTLIHGSRTLLCVLCVLVLPQLEQRLTKYLEIVAAIFEKEEQMAAHSKTGDDPSAGGVRRMSLASAKEVIATVATSGPSLLNNLSARQQPGIGGGDTAAARRNTLSMLAGAWGVVTLGCHVAVLSCCGLASRVVVFVFACSLLCGVLSSHARSLSHAHSRMLPPPPPPPPLFVVLAGKASSRVYRSMMDIQPDVSAANVRVQPNPEFLPPSFMDADTVQSDEDGGENSDDFLAGLAEAAQLNESAGSALRRKRNSGVVVQRESLKRLSAMLSDKRTRRQRSVRKGLGAPAARSKKLLPGVGDGVSAPPSPVRAPDVQ